MNQKSPLRIGVFGASGRVGKLVVEAVLAAPDMKLAAATVSDASAMLGQPVPDGDLAYTPLAGLPFGACDAVVDFSKPAAVMDLLEADRDGRIPLIIGTTGFDADQQARLEAAARGRAVVLGANFGRGFPAFMRLAAALAAAEPGVVPRVSEVYHARKKAEPSGTSLLLAGAVAEAGGRAGTDIGIDVAREGETVGINGVSADFGPAMIEIRYTVRSLASYAEGALAATRWAVDCPPGLYTLTDIGTAIQDKGGRA